MLVEQEGNVEFTGKDKDFFKDMKVEKREKLIANF